MTLPKRVLMICDDADLSELYSEILRSCGVEEITIIPQSKSLKKDYDLVIADCRDNPEELRKIIDRNTKILYIISEEFGNMTMKNVTFVRKPFDIDSFIAKLRE